MKSALMFVAMLAVAGAPAGMGSAVASEAKDPIQELTASYSGLS